MQEYRVFILDVEDTDFIQADIENWENIGYIPSTELSDEAERFIVQAETSGEVFSLNGFQNALNRKEININKMIDTRDLVEKREELQTNLVDSFNNYFDTEIEDFDELTKHIDNSEDEDVQKWKEDNSDDFDHIEEIDELEDEITNFFYGKALIPNDDFTEYCKDMEEDCYNLKGVPDFIKDNINWDGVASDLEVDYSSVTYQGESYFYRD